MNTKKTATDAVIAANQRNSQKSPGPVTDQGKAASRLNALKHGFTAKTVIPDKDGDDTEYQHALTTWRNYFKPHGAWEEALVREIACLQRKDSTLETLENRELSNFAVQLGGVEGVFDTDLKLPIDGLDLPIQRGWECDRIIVRATAGKDDTLGSGQRGPGFNQGQPVPGCQVFNAAHGNTGRHIEVQAVLGSTLNRILRYRAAVKKDLYRAIEALRAAQAERRARENMKSTGFVTTRACGVPDVSSRHIKSLGSMLAGPGQAKKKNTL